MRFWSLVLGVVVILGALFWAANDYVPVPQGVRDLWDKAWSKKVEPAKEKWEEQKRKYETTTPKPQTFSLAPAANFPQIVCTLPVCAA